MTESVKVAVRVRPFNTRELERSSKCIIKMDNNSTLITDPEDPTAEPKKFTFDFSYWSHDSFDTKPDGVMVPVSSKYADQQKVFDDLGRGVLANAFAGFNTSLFAYGQTGSGKSYSMVGYGANKGIVPLACDALFSTIDENKKTGAASTRYQVTLSMLEIYNEQVRDLLSKDQNVKGGLPVRQNTQLGRFYVQGLCRVPVFSYAEIERRINEGTSNRTLAATKMNATSSRAHTVVTILFEQIQKNSEGKETTKSSEINLVDLAGSERAASTGASGDTLKEGSMINKSLSCLGNVISALAELSTSKRKIVVPYRDSVLTKLLQNSLGGNSKTIMIAALSPADINYDETLSTLRYADRAKQIKNTAVVNESATDKLIRSLKEENERLKKMLESGGAVEVRAGMSDDDVQALRRHMEEEIRAQLEENMRTIDVDEGSWERARQTGAAEDSPEVREEQIKKQKLASTPHLVNLNEDPMLSNVIFHFLEKPSTVIGKHDESSSPDVVLSGLSIRKEHAIISIRNGALTIRPGNSIAKTKVNGAPLAGEQPLQHQDRILFGSNHMYVFLDPRSKNQPAGVPDVVTWDFAQNEIAKAKGFQTDHNGLSIDQLRTQEQVLELLPLLSEANAISEEMSKGRSFEVALLSGIARGERSKDASTQVLVKMRNSLNGNEWLWPREKFMDRRFLFQTLYQDWCDSDYNDRFFGPPSKQDPFYEPVEDMLIGTANAYLQSLSYALDFQDTLSIVDYKGEEQGRVRIVVAPCTADGSLLDDDFVVDEPAELLDKPFSFTVTIVSVDINKVRFSKGLCCKYLVFGQTTASVTPVVRGLNVVFNHSARFHFPKTTAELLEWLESGCLSLRFFATQEETDDVALSKAVRRGSNVVVPAFNKQTSMIADDSVKRHFSVSGAVGALSELDEAPDASDSLAKIAQLTTRIAELEAELQQQTRRSGEGGGLATTDQRINELERDLQQVNLKYASRERRMHQMLETFHNKPPAEQTYQSLYTTMASLINAPDKFRRVASVLGAVKVAYNIHTANLQQAAAPAPTAAPAPAPAAPTAAPTSETGAASKGTGVGLAPPASTERSSSAPTTVSGEVKSKACTVM